MRPHHLRCARFLRKTGHLRSAHAEWRAAAAIKKYAINLNQTLRVRTKTATGAGRVVSVRNYLPSTIVLTTLIVAPAFAADQSAQPLSSPLTQAPAPLPPYFGGSGAGSLPQSSDPFANEFGMLPGPHPVGLPANSVNWGGFYVGGQFGYSDANGDFSNTTQAPIADSLRELTLESEFAPSNWPVLGTASHGTTGFGGFVGYNIQYLTPEVKVVLGVEANFDEASLSLIAPNSPISRITPADSQGDNYLVNITGSGTVTNLDFGTLRARAGYAFGNFLPYAFVGGALGHANVNITETTSGEQNPPASGTCSSSSNPPCTPFSFTGTAGTSSEWLYGGTVGAGLDVALTRNIFVRAEYEYVYFAPVASLQLNINTVRVGAGIKF
jgi:outer membrane immunogenic protein